MEKVVWAVAFASENGSPRASVRSADHMLEKLRAIGSQRGTRLDPEIEAARANIEIPRADFDVWYRTALRIRLGNGRQFKEPQEQDYEAAYERFMLGRTDYY